MNGGAEIEAKRRNREPQELLRWLAPGDFEVPARMLAHVDHVEVGAQEHARRGVLLDDAEVKLAERASALARHRVRRFPGRRWLPAPGGEQRIEAISGRRDRALEDAGLRVDGREQRPIVG